MVEGGQYQKQKKKIVGVKLLLCMHTDLTYFMGGGGGVGGRGLPVIIPP